ncbi:hypothetical protein PR048_002362 [Dryococelus australis]|uniref:Uncharacterized protein n=1 Tax=Dryococelus australis TaxID=614101 RepID=A0ABQ9IJZ8_9NEOP|nr:hypothetical protein PR048_002362 [Dryococelus australis]
MPLVGGFPRGCPVSPAPHSDAAPYSPRFTLFGSQDLDVKSAQISSFTHTLTQFNRARADRGRRPWRVMACVLQLGGHVTQRHSRRRLHHERHDAQLERGAQGGACRPRRRQPQLRLPEAAAGVRDLQTCRGCPWERYTARPPAPLLSPPQPSTPLHNPPHPSTTLLDPQHHTTTTPPPMLIPSRAEFWSSLKSTPVVPAIACLALKLRCREFQILHVHAALREHCTPVQSPARRGDGALVTWASVTLIVPTLLGLKLRKVRCWPTGAYTKDEVERSRWLRTTNLRAPTLNYYSVNASSENGVERRRLKERFPSLALAEDDEEQCRQMLHCYQSLILSKDLCEGNCALGETCPTGLCRNPSKSELNKTETSRLTKQNVDQHNCPSCDFNGPAYQAGRRLQLFPGRRRGGRVGRQPGEGRGLMAASTCVRSYDGSAFFTELKRT